MVIKYVVGKYKVGTYKVYLRSVVAVIGLSEG